jgi:hypothetical protein
VIAALLHDIRAFIHRYVHLSSEEAILTTLWTAMTHVLAAFDYTAYLHITSPLPECGKSRLLEVLESLVAQPWLTGRVTAAVLMRKIDAQHPTLLLDESDAAFNGDEQYAESLRGMLNSGFHRSGKASCCVGQGANMTFRDFSVFGPKAIAGIGRLPSTVESRSIPIALKRRRKDERIDKWRHRDAWASAGALRDQLKSVLTDKVEGLRQARPLMPKDLSDRAEDVLEPLCAVADLAGGPWPEDTRAAAVVLMNHSARASHEADQNMGLELLIDSCRIWDGFSDSVEAIASKQFLEALVAMDDRPWPTFGRQGKPITMHRVARLLKPFGIIPADDLWIEAKKRNGYRRVLFEDAFARYLDIKSRTPGKVNNNGHEPADFNPRIEPVIRDCKTSLFANNDGPIPGVRDLKPGS